MTVRWCENLTVVSEQFKCLWLPLINFQANCVDPRTQIPRLPTVQRLAHDPVIPQGERYESVVQRQFPSAVQLFIEVA
jgi:hypothetical protein